MGGDKAVKGFSAKKVRRAVVTDCGSTTTKALMFEEIGGRWRYIFRGEAPTTVEAPVEDVTVGVLNAFQELEEISGKRFVKWGSGAGGNLFIPYGGEREGIDLYLSTSSAGGGLQMLVAGVVGQISAASAQRAALGAGAIVLDVLSVDDGRDDFEKIERVRGLRPDIILLAGGTDGGDRAHVIEAAEVVLAASPKPRFGRTLKLPIIYAGNREARDEVKRILSSIGEVVLVQNLRPSLEEERIEEARDAIHNFFLSHVMSHSPGYGKLLNWTARPVMPTPAAVGRIVESYARSSGLQVLCVDIGGATTDIFSVVRDRGGKWRFSRTVSANYGMSYSIANVFLESGIDGVRRWLPFSVSLEDVTSMVYNKMIRPTSIPYTVEELAIEQAVCREALRLSLSHHIELTREVKESRGRGIAGIFSQQAEESLDLMKVDLVIGSGGVLSHAPFREQSAVMLLEGFQLCGLTQIMVDSVFMLPHLGVFSEVSEGGAREILENDCLINVAFSIVPLWRKRYGRGTPLAVLKAEGREVLLVRAGDAGFYREFSNREVELEVIPLRGDVDVGGGVGRRAVLKVSIGQCGILIDARGRPLNFSGELFSHFSFSGGGERLYREEL